MTTCPKCGYVRKPTDTAPDWECPSCNIAYAKFHAVHQDRPMYDTRMTRMSPGVLGGISIMIPGAWMVLRGIGWIGPVPYAGYTDPGYVAGGTIVFCLGWWFVVVALSLSERATRSTGHVIWTCLAMVLTWVVFTTGFESLAYTSMGPMSGVQFWRALVVAFDLYVALSVFDNVLEELSSAPAAKRNKFAYAVGCIALAFTLELSGALPKVYAKLGLKLPGPAATIGILQSHHLWDQAPNLPLEEFAGDWAGAFQKSMPGSPGHGAGAITRVHVSVANGEARMQLWRFCPPRECDAGSFPAIIESRRRGTVVALHVTGSVDGTDWLVSLSTQTGHLLLEEQRIRGMDMNTRRQFSDWMDRPKN